MPFKYISGRLIPVKHKTVFGRLVEVGGLYDCPRWPRYMAIYTTIGVKRDLERLLRAAIKRAKFRPPA